MNQTGMFVLKSGRWRYSIEEGKNGEVMELVDPGEPTNKMVVPLPFSWRSMTEEQVQDYVRSPEVRLWVDNNNTFWRISVVGPGTRYDVPFTERYLVFDSKQTWAGIVEFPLGELGDMTDVELQWLRDQIRDFGGRRRHFRYSVH
jgi:hypothetical protein